MDMDTSKDSWNACLQYRNKQLTKQLKDYQKVSALTKCSSSLIVAMGQLLCLHQKPSYGIIKDEAEWRDLFIVIDLFYGGCLSEELIRARLDNKTIALLFNIVPRSVLKAKQRIKNKLALSATDSLDMHIQQC